MNLEHLKQLYAKATQGEWSEMVGSEFIDPDDGKFIAALVNAYPEIVKELEEHRTWRQRFKDYEIEELYKGYHAGRALAEAVEVVNDWAYVPEAKSQLQRAQNWLSEAIATYRESIK